MRHTMLSSRYAFLLGALLIGVLTLNGCKELTGNPGLPAGVPDPSSFNNAAGAVGLRNAAAYEFELAVGQYIVDAGLLTDELEDVQTGTSTGILLSTTGVSDPLDERILPVNTQERSYVSLQYARGYANLAVGALATYDTAPADTTTARVLRGEMYAFQGYAEILLADLFCSGVPLSTLDFQHDITYHPSSTTAGVYQDAIAKFDMALSLAAGRSDSVRQLALLGKGRAYLALNNYPAAADDVTTVPTTFVYQVSVPLLQVWVNLSTDLSFESDYHKWMATVSDREGENGLPFISSGDPRSTVVTIFPTSPGSGGPFVPTTIPTKYSAALSSGLGSYTQPPNGTQSAYGFAPFVLASGVEARLIEAEAALSANPNDGRWLTLLNQLRQTAPIPGTAQPDPQSLTPLSDPVDPVARIDTLFAERAYWLFADGHRQGDLRRLLRQYNRYSAFNDQSKVYPIGPYLAPGTGQYGTDVTAPIDPAESANPYFHGCLDRKP